MLRKASRQGGSTPASRAASCTSGDSRSPPSAKRASGPHEVARALPRPRVQRVRALHVLLDEVLVVLGRPRCRGPVGRRSRPRSIAYVSGRRERDERAFDLALGKLEPRRPADGLERGLAGSLEGFDQRSQLAARGRAVEAADADVDRVDLASADECHQLVPGLLQRQPTLDEPPARHVPARPRPRSRGSRARGACRRGGRGSRSTRRSRGCGAAPGSAPGPPRRRRPPSPGPSSSGTRPGRFRRSAR